MKFESLRLEFFVEEAKFDHIGIAVKSIKEGIDKHLKLVSDPIRKVTLAFVKMDGIKVKLTEPLGDSTLINTSLMKRQKLLHLCFQVT